MTNKLSWFGITLVLAVLAAGCSYSCEDLCADAEDQGCGESGCQSACEKSEQLAEEADCVDPWDEVMSCASDHSDDACTNDTPCQAETDAFTDCVAPYCQHNPSLCI